MKYKILKTLAAMVFVAGFMIVLKSCKKIDEGTNNTLKKEEIEKIKQQIIASNQPISITTDINEPANEVYYTDANGERIKKLFRPAGRPAYVPVCNTPYDENGDPIDDMIPTNFNLIQTGFNYSCSAAASNYLVTFKWEVSVHHLIQESNTYGVGGATLRTRYNLKIKNSAGTVIGTYNSNLIPADNISSPGDDPIDPTRKKYFVQATIVIPTSVFTNGVTYETIVTLATNCNLTPQISMGHTTTSVSSLNTQPCLRTDKVWINPASSPSGYPSYAGTFIVCSIPYGYVTALNHDLQYRQKNTTGTTWETQTSTITTVPTFSTYTGLGYMSNISYGSGVWFVRYRNNKSCTPTAPWAVETWTF